MREGERLQCKGLVYPTHNHTHTGPGPLWPALAATLSRLSKVDKAVFRPRTPRCNSVLTALRVGLQGGGVSFRYVSARGSPLPAMLGLETAKVTKERNKSPLWTVGSFNLPCEVLLRPCLVGGWQHCRGGNW